MIRLLNRLKSSRKTVGYRVEDELYQSYNLSVEDVVTLAEQGKIEGVKCKNKSLASDGLDLRKLKIFNLDKLPSTLEFNTLDDLLNTLDDCNEPKPLSDLLDRRRLEDSSKKDEEFTEVPDLEERVVSKEHIDYVDVPQDVAHAYLYLEEETKLYKLDYFVKDGYPVCDDWVGLASKDKEYRMFLKDIYAMHKNINKTVLSIQKVLTGLGFKWDGNVQSTYLNNLAFNFNHETVSGLTVTLANDIVNFNGKLSVRLAITVLNTEGTDKVNATKKKLARAFKDTQRGLKEINLIGGVNGYK